MIAFIDDHHGAHGVDTALVPKTEKILNINEGTLRASSFVLQGGNYGSDKQGSG